MSRFPTPPTRLALALLCTLASAPVAANHPTEPLQVTIEGHYDNAVGSSDAASQGVIRGQLLQSRPAQRPGEVLEFVPGVIVTQHSGDGKANQYFLRGFNLDHGTDFATWVDGMPVNLPSHGHGQGYSDLNFLIPELVARIAYAKGPYAASGGDFAAAGSAEIVYRRSLARPMAQLTLGERGHRRLLAAGSTALAGGPTLLGALEVMNADGPWTLPQDLRKLNGVLSLSRGDSQRGWHVAAMGYDARWNATDQVPQRALDAGLIGRHDTIDPTSGGASTRHSLSADWHEHGADTTTQVAAYLLRYRMALYSNFTYALERPALGDQFEQSDRRTVAGLRASRRWDHALGDRFARTELGLQLRHDDIAVGLYDTVARVRSATTREDDVRQSALGVYAENTLQWTPWLRSVAGLRADHVRFRVRSSLDANSGRTSDSQLSPKLSLVFGPWARTELFANAGRGFHSNDARGTTTTVDPKSGDATERVPGLVAARGWELGARTEWLRGLQSSLALWQLRSDSELVYVGDAGSTEANRPSRRSGVEWNNRWVPLPWLLVDADLAWNRARFADADPAGSRIPGAVERVASFAVTLRERGPWSASLQWRYLGPRPLVEDNSVRAPSSLLTNLRLGWRMHRDAELTLDVFNLGNRRVNDIEYFYVSRLPGEAAPVADRHLHPAEPRSARLSLKVLF